MIEVLSNYSPPTSSFHIAVAERQLVAWGVRCSWCFVVSTAVSFSGQRVLSLAAIWLSEIHFEVFLFLLRQNYF